MSTYDYPDPGQSPAYCDGLAADGPPDPWLCDWCGQTFLRRGEEGGEGEESRYCSETCAVQCARHATEERHREEGADTMPSDTVSPVAPTPAIDVQVLLKDIRAILDHSTMKIATEAHLAVVVALLNEMYLYTYDSSDLPEQTDTLRRWTRDARVVLGY